MNKIFEVEYNAQLPQLTKQGLTLVDFYATWCGPCQMQAPILEDVKQRLGDSVSVVKIDVDRNSEAAAMYNVRSIPTLMLFKDGKQLWRGTGLHQAEDLIATVHEHIG